MRLLNVIVKTKNVTKIIVFAKRITNNAVRVALV
jgi:hypothetical protein